MLNDNLFGTYVFPEKNTHPITLTETQTIESKSDNVHQQINSVPITSLIYLSLLLGVVYWLSSILAKKSSSTQDSKLAFQRFSHIPCRNCRFLAKNQYLKCAVRPSVVLKSEAADCSDFRCKNDSD